MARETINVNVPPNRSSTQQSMTTSSSRPASSTSRPGSSSMRATSRNESPMRASSPSKLVTGRPPSSRQSTRAASRHNSARLRRQTSQHANTLSFYDRATRILGKASDERQPDELNVLEGWFRKKSKLFEKLNRSKSHPGSITRDIVAFVFPC